MSYRSPVKRLSTLLVSRVDRTFENTFQNRSVSSPAPVTILSPSGDTAKYKTWRTNTKNGQLA